MRTFNKIFFPLSTFLKFLMPILKFQVSSLMFIRHTCNSPKKWKENRKQEFRLVTYKTLDDFMWLDKVLAEHIESSISWNELSKFCLLDLERKKGNESRVTYNWMEVTFQ